MAQQASFCFFCDVHFWCQVKEHSFNISKDIFDLVLNCFSVTTYDAITPNFWWLSSLSLMAFLAKEKWRMNLDISYSCTCKSESEEEREPTTQPLSCLIWDALIQQQVCGLHFPLHFVVVAQLRLKLKPWMTLKKYIVVSVTFVIRSNNLKWTENRGFKENVKNVSLYMYLCTMQSFLQVVVNSFKSSIYDREKLKPHLSK